MNNTLRGFFFLILVIFLIWAENAFPSEESHARSLGLAGCYTTLSSGIEAPFWNPANLGFPQNPKFSFNLFSLGAKLGNNSFSVKDYNQYNGKFLNPSDKEKILNSIPSQGFDMNLDLGASALGFSLGQFAVTSQFSGISFLSLPKDPFELALMGNKLNEHTILDQANSEACAYFSLIISHGRRLFLIKGKDIFAGINLRWIRGIAYQKTVKAEGDFITRETEIQGEANFISRQAMGGEGYGIDLGLASILNENWTLGFFIINPLNQIKWSKKAQEKVYRIVVDSLTLESSSDDSVVKDEDFTRDLGSFITQLPTVINLGLSRKTSGLSLSLNWEQGFKNCAGSTNTPKVSLGTEYYLLSWLPLRSGISIGGREGFVFATGLGIDLGSSHLDFGLSTQKGILPSYGKGISLAVTSWFEIK
jgi:hypothetical protein